MNVGAVGYSTDYYRAGYRKNSSNDSVSKFTTIGSATQQTTSSNNGKTWYGFLFKDEGICIAVRI